MEKQLSIGIFGVGHLGKIHVKLLSELTSKYQIVGFYDPSDEAALYAESHYGLKRYTDAHALIEISDCIDIITPTLEHFDIASKAIRSSKHVFIEKPATETPEQAKSLMHLAHEAGVHVQIGHVERYNPAFIAARPLIYKPLFFEIHRLATYNPRGTDVSVVMDLMIHDIDIVLSLVNARIKRISANGVAVVSNTPDIASVRIEFDNGCVANITSSRISTHNMRKMRIFQPSGYISIDFLNHEVEHLKISEKIQSVLSPENGIKDPSLAYISERPEIIKTNAIQEELCAFHKSITENQVVEVTIDAAYQALEVANQITEKLKIAFMSLVDNK
jgi:predicted dehydrogenase